MFVKRKNLALQQPSTHREVLQTSGLGSEPTRKTCFQLLYAVIETEQESI